MYVSDVKYTIDAWLLVSVCMVNCRSREFVQWVVRSIRKWVSQVSSEAKVDLHGYMCNDV